MFGVDLIQKKILAKGVFNMHLWDWTLYLRSKQNMFLWMLLYLDQQVGLTMFVCKLPQFQYKAGENKGPCELACSVEMISQLIVSWSSELSDSAHTAQTFVFWLLTKKSYLSLWAFRSCDKHFTGCSNILWTINWIIRKENKRLFWIWIDMKIILSSHPTYCKYFL